jgi:Uncharacterized ACR, COG1399.
MSKEISTPFYRPFVVSQIRPGGMEIRVEANDIERATVAADFNLAELRSLVGDFKLSGRPERIKVVGIIQADIQQICVVSLEPFDSILKEDIELVFTEESRRKRAGEDIEFNEDIPDPIVNGQIDLGAIALEFLALGLDPYPRKPGISFDEVKKALGMEDDAPTSLGDFADEKSKGGS